MKILDKIGLALFSTLVLLGSVITCFIIFGWLDADLVYSIIVRS